MGTGDFFCEKVAGPLQVVDYFAAAVSVAAPSAATRSATRSVRDPGVTVKRCGASPGCCRTATSNGTGRGAIGPGALHSGTVANPGTVVAEIAAQTARPAGVVVNGDLATDGSPPTAGAYRHLAQLLDPLTKRGMPIHLTMGNCDRRSLFAETLTEMLPGTPPVAGRLVNVLQTERANFFLLDSLYNTERTVTEGDLGMKQIEWLARALDQHAKKPAIVICHHNVNQLVAKSVTAQEGGLRDGAALVDVLRPRKHVKAFIFGHTHEWRRWELDGIHFINLPTTAYIFDPDEPRGWVDLRLEKSGMSLMLESLDKTHPKHGKKLVFRWRK